MHGFEEPRYKSIRFGIKGPLEVTDDLTGGAGYIDVSQDI
jgi:hypothetical protein